MSTRGLVNAADLPEEVRAVGGERVSESVEGIPPLETAERALIARALRAAGGNQARAAQMLQIDRRRIYRKVRRYDLHSLVSHRQA